MTIAALLFAVSIAVYALVYSLFTEEELQHYPIVPCGGIAMLLCVMGIWLMQKVGWLPQTPGPEGQLNGLSLMMMFLTGGLAAGCLWGRANDGRLVCGRETERPAGTV